MTDLRPAEAGSADAPPQEASRVPPRDESGATAAFRVPVYGLFLLAVVATLYFAESFLIPVTLAFLLTLILSPIVRALRRRGIPEGVAAVAIVLTLGACVGGGAWLLSKPVAEWINQAPSIGHELRWKLAELREPIEAVKEAKRNVDEATKSASPEPGVQEVVVRERGLLDWAASGVPEILASAGLTFFLLLFLLASGDLFYEKLVRSMPTLEDKKRWLHITRDVEREVSRYLFTVTAINAGLGMAITAGLYAAGMPDPALWGLSAALLNFIPYLGATVGIFAVAIVSIVSFPTLGEALIPPAIYAVLNTLEGQLVTPALVGRRLQINSVATFLAIAFGGWLWGVVGILVAVPILIVVKTFAHHADGLDGLEEFLSVRREPGAG